MAMGKKSVAVPALAVFGSKSKGGALPPEDDDGDDDGELPEDFAAFATEALGTDDDTKLRALKHAIEECVKGY
jgi:hypothetical protein